MINQTIQVIKDIQNFTTTQEETEQSVLGYLDVRNVLENFMRWAELYTYEERNRKSLKQLIEYTEKTLNKKVVFKPFEIKYKDGTTHVIESIQKAYLV